MVEKSCRIYTWVKENYIGFIQKPVNMIVNYLYVIKVCGIEIELDYQIVESDYDCPLDSKILKQISKDTRKKY